MELIQQGARLRSSLNTRGPSLKRFSQRVRSRHLFALDTLGLVVATSLAISAWRDTPLTLQIIGDTAWIAGIVVFTQLAVNIMFGLYRTSWRFASIQEMWRVIRCAVAGTLSAALIVLGIFTTDPPVVTGPPPVSYWLVGALLTLIVLAGPRFLIRSASEMSHRTNDQSGRKHTLLYGAGWAGVMIARSADRSPDSDVMPVGFLDDNLDIKGRRVAGLPVYGDVTSMAQAKRATDATSLLITMPRASGPNVRRVVDAAIRHGLEVRTVPPVTDLIDGTIDARQTRRIRVGDLLRRPPATEHAPALKQILSGNTVMVTGAAGSIGSELVRQLLALEPSHIVMVDQAESAMYMVARDLDRRSAVMKGTTRISTHLVDVTDRDAVSRVMKDVRPAVVFHAAAYKHVPMLESHVSQAVLTNVGGTRSAVDAAIEHDVERFVLVSTDKAVKPSSIMGATKRIAEMIVADAARRSGRPYVSVRFGNVLGSNGSVIPVFQSQLEAGQPLTITDPEMTRYFMTIPEASWLILDAAAICESGRLYVLDMGEPVRLMDIATDLIRLSGRDPESVPIEFIGLRPGEKLHEELFYTDEDVTPTDVPKVLRSESTRGLPQTIAADVDRFVAMSRAGDDDGLRTEVLDYVRVEIDVESSSAPTNSEVVRVPSTPADNGYRPVVVVPVHTNGSSGSAVGVHRTTGNGSSRPEGIARPAAGARSSTARRRRPDVIDERHVVAAPSPNRDRKTGAPSSERHPQETTGADH